MVNIQRCMSNMYYWMFSNCRALAFVVTVEYFESLSTISGPCQVAWGFVNVYSVNNAYSVHTECLVCNVFNECTVTMYTSTALCTLHATYGLYTLNADSEYWMCVLCTLYILRASCHSPNISETEFTTPNLDRRPPSWVPRLLRTLETMKIHNESCKTW